MSTTSTDEVPREARNQAQQILQAAEHAAAAILERARVDAERRTLVVIENAKRVYEGAVRDAAAIRGDAERQAAEIVAAARRQLDLAVELRVELRREIDADHTAGAPLRIVPEPPHPPSIAS